MNPTVLVNMSVFEDKPRVPTEAPYLYLHVMARFAVFGRTPGGKRGTLWMDDRVESRDSHGKFKIMRFAQGFRERVKVWRTQNAARPSGFSNEAVAGWRAAEEMLRALSEIYSCYDDPGFEIMLADSPELGEFSILADHPELSLIHI